MNRQDFSDLSPDQLYAGFNQVRRHLSGRFEAEHSSERDAQRRRAWLEKRPKEIDRRLLKACGITHEEIEKGLAAESAAYRAHCESVAERDQATSGDPDFGLPRVPDSGTSAAFPYAVVVIGDTAKAVEALDSEASGNPDAWKVAGFSARQEFFLELVGSGTGFYDASLIPEYNTSTYLAIQWYFLHVPFGDGEWSCSASPWFHGAYHVWSEDYFLTSRYAGVSMAASLCLLPFGYPSPKYQAMQCTSHTIIKEQGQNIDDARWGGWIPSLAKLAPEPAHRQKPHWIIVTAFGQVAVRGYAHARLDFAKGYTTSGSVEGGSYRATKYGVYCDKATIHW
jgi:hypothetical protein